MARLKAFVTRVLPEKAMTMVQQACDAEVWPHENPPPSDVLVRRIQGRDGLLSLLTDTIDAKVMDAAPSLKVISNCAVGVDNVDVLEATRRGIPVGNTPDVLTNATADMAFALLLAAARRVVEGVEYVRAGKWKTWNLQLLLGADLAGSTLGIVGLGRIGRAVAVRAQGFGLHVVYHDSSATSAEAGRPVSFDELLQVSDFVSLHVPLTPQTRHMIDDAAIRRMKPNAILINTSRGPVVDHDALYEALRSHRIAGAGLDVTEPEPIQPDSPLLALENCIIVPHLGSASRWTREQMAVLAAENLIAGLERRRLPHCVNPEVYG